MSNFVSQAVAQKFLDLLLSRLSYFGIQINEAKTLKREDYSRKPSLLTLPFQLLRDRKYWAITSALQSYASILTLRS